MQLKRGTIGRDGTVQIMMEPNALYSIMQFLLIHLFFLASLTILFPLSKLKFNGTYVRVGIPADANFTYNWVPLIFTQRAIAGSVVTGSVRTNSLLSTAAAHWDALKDTDNWKVEVVPFEKVNEAINNLKARRNKGYRYVLEW
jgi:D-arabinose 1-dehydrogenase-like Zn-dependent alcohol dehydrogenase